MLTESTTTLAATDTSAAVLTWSETIIAVAVIAVAMLLTGVIIAVARAKTPQSGNDSLVRAWIALALVVGLVLFCAFSFAVNDTTLRSTLIGGLTASVAAAIAFYFSSKSNEQANQQLAAAVGTETVPDLTGLTEEQAATALGRTTLSLQTVPAQTPATGNIAGQTPAANSQARNGSTVIATF